MLRVAWGCGHCYRPALSHMTETEKQGFKVAFILDCNDRRALARGALKPQYLEKSDQKDKGETKTGYVINFWKIS